MSRVQYIVIESSVVIEFGSPRAVLSLKLSAIKQLGNGSLR